MNLILNTIFGKNSMLGYVSSTWTYTLGIFGEIEWLQVASGVGGLLVLGMSIYKLYVEISNKKKADERSSEMHLKELELIDQKIIIGSIAIDKKGNTTVDITEIINPSDAVLQVEKGTLSDNDESTLFVEKN